MLADCGRGKYIRSRRSALGRRPKISHLLKFRHMSTKLILVLGATGAQGLAVVDALLAPAADGFPSPYSVRAVTRDSSSKRARDLAAKGVEVLRGDTDDLASIAVALKGVYGAWVNIDGFTVGEQREIFTGMRTFELAKHAGVRHLIWSSIDYVTKKGGYDPLYRVDHQDAKGRVAEWLKAQPSVVSDDELSWSVVTTGPYMEMLNGIMGPLNLRDDGTVVFAAPIENGKAPLIALADVGYFARYTFDHREATSAQELEVVSETVGWDQLVETFTKVTGHKAVFKRQTIEEWLRNYADPERPVAADAAPGSTTWGQNFSGWWRVYRDNVVTRDEAWNRKMNPNGYTLEKWMRETKYDGTLSADILKLSEDKKGINVNFEKLKTL
ncbi:NAD-P-binding protein [Auriscalpium vulgare]|uniref:NAD-P-binding protein n=1 Tax=Auriscalpium vulgare TaxID=40419 RepID=A0ACB8RJ41_9AGAM|nr:NAD-P-binding protein [Auriscalpium vulgare]